MPVEVSPAPIVVGFVPSPPGRAALLAGIEEAKLRNAALYVLNSSRGDSLDDPGWAHESDLEWVRATCEESQIKVDVRQQYRSQEASNELVKLIEEVNAQLCVIGIRNRSVVGKMLLGSNAHRILMEAPCRVLTVKADRSS